MNESWRVSNTTNSKIAIRLLFALVGFDFFREVMPSLVYIFYYPETEFIYPHLLSFLYAFEPRWISAFLILSSFPIYIVTVFKYQSQSWRILAFLHFMISRGFMFSFVRYSHMYLPIFWVMMCLAVCPSFNTSAGQKYYRQTYFSCLFSLALFYAYPGVWKIVLALQKGSFFDVEFGANTIAHYLITHGKYSLLGDFFVSNPAISNVSMAFVILFQILTLGAVFVGKSQRLWALMIVLFHTINVFVLSVNFFIIGFVAFIFFYFSPFSRAEEDWLTSLFRGRQKVT